jgi:translation initiation factor SUI1
MLALTPAERNGRKTLTTIEGIPSKFDLKKILKVIKKQFACNGTIVNDEKAGDVIQLQGDQRNAVKDFLVDKEKGLEIDSKTIKASLGRFGFTSNMCRSMASNRPNATPRHHEG